MQQLIGKVAVITGGASGIGLAMAHRFGGQGMKLVIADIEPKALEIALVQLQAKGYDVLGVRTDVSKYEDVEALARATLRTFGKVHVVCNNAGVSILGPTWEQSLDDWRWVYGVNVWGVIHGIKAFVPILIQQSEPAHVINTASLASFGPVGEHSPYCSSKAAVWSISHSLYSELKAHNHPIGVSLVCPGMVATDIHRSWRNRPPSDRAWSDRESHDPNVRAAAERFQGSGIEPERVADDVLSALKSDRFFVLSSGFGERLEPFLHARFDFITRGEQPPVVTWGPDLRPKEGDDAPSPGVLGLDAQAFAQRRPKRG